MGCDVGRVFDTSAQVLDVEIQLVGGHVVSEDAGVEVANDDLEVLLHAAVEPGLAGQPEPVGRGVDHGAVLHGLRLD